MSSIYTKYLFFKEYSHLKIRIKGLKRVKWWLKVDWHLMISRWLSFDCLKFCSPFDYRKNIGKIKRKVRKENANIAVDVFILCHLLGQGGHFLLVFFFFSNNVMWKQLGHGFFARTGSGIARCNMRSWVWFDDGLWSTEGATVTRW